MKVSKSKYIKDTLYPKIVDAFSRILKEKKFVSPLDIFRELFLLEKKHIEDWRFKRVPFLEKVLKCNLHKASRILQISKHHANDLDLKPSKTVYMKFGKGPKIILRFTKTGDKNIEEAYSTHFVKKRSEEEQPE